MEKTPNTSVADKIAATKNCDVLLYSGDITRTGSTELIQSLCARRKAKNVLLVMVTFGGDPDAAYKIARSLQQKYETFSMLVPGPCKSAGTMVALGANELVVSSHGELGPIDVQMSKKDELWETQSGLTVNDALQTLQEKVHLAFDHFVMQTKATEGAITLKTATEIAAKLTTGLFAPIYSQIDPMHVGEAGRAMSIAREYGRRLLLKGKNSTTKSLSKLISGYPSHTFVIDHEEAGFWFNQVREPDQDENELVQHLGEICLSPAQQLKVEYLSKELEIKDDTAATDVRQQSGEGAGTPESAAAAGAGSQGR